jgi:hypothetical protein
MALSPSQSTTAVYKPPPCPICIEPLFDNIGILPNCGHAFHFECVKPWTKAHKNCPECRKRSLGPVKCFYNIQRQPLGELSNGDDGWDVDLTGSEPGQSGNGGDGSPPGMSKSQSAKLVAKLKLLKTQNDTLAKLLRTEHENRSQVEATRKQLALSLRDRTSKLGEAEKQLKDSQRNLFRASKKKNELTRAMDRLKEERSQLLSVANAKEYAESSDLLTLIRKSKGGNMGGRDGNQKVIESQHLALRICRKDFEKLYKKNTDLESTLKTLSSQNRTLAKTVEEKKRKLKQFFKQAIGGENRGAAKRRRLGPDVAHALRDAAGAGENLYAKGSFTDDTYKTMQGQSRGRRSDSKALLARPSATAQGGGASRQIPTTSTAHAPKGAQSNDVSAARTYALAVARGKSGTSSSSTFRTGLSKKRTFASSTGAASKSSYMRHGFNGLGGTHKVILNTSDRRKVQRGGHLLSKKAPPRQKQQLKVNNFFQR